MQGVQPFLFWYKEEWTLLFRLYQFYSNGNTEEGIWNERSQFAQGLTTFEEERPNNHARFTLNKFHTKGECGKKEYNITVADVAHKNWSTIANNIFPDRTSKKMLFKEVAGRESLSLLLNIQRKCMPYPVERRPAEKCRLRMPHGKPCIALG